jgi:hypothetical protein
MKRIALLALAVSLATVATALAATTVRDRDDVSTPLDIAKTTGAHNRSSDQLVHLVQTFEDFQASDMANDDPAPSSICILIWTRSKPGEAPPDYEACATPDKRGRTLKGTVAREREEGPMLRVGTAKIERPDDKSVVFRIDPDLIKRPRSYRWRAETTSFGGKCKSASGCPDYAPDRPATAESRIGQPKSG